MDEATWAALAAALTAGGLIWTWLAFRRRGAANGLRALGFTLLPAAAWLTGTLEMFTEIGTSIADWASGLVLDPLTWTGIGLAALAGVLFVISGFIRDRQLGRAQRSATVRGAEAPQGALAPRPGAPAPSTAVDDDLADIEAILRKRGIE